MKFVLSVFTLTALLRYGEAKARGEERHNRLRRHLTGHTSKSSKGGGCALGENNCHEFATCIDLQVGFSCACSSGYEGDGTTTGTGCTNINECERNLDDCVENADCFDLVGTFECLCAPGYTGNGHVQCQDIDECQEGNDECDPNATCTNTEGK